MLNIVFYSICDVPYICVDQMREMELKERLAGVDHLNQDENEVRRQLNEAHVATSQAQLETARLANEKLQLEQQVRWLQGEAMRDRKQLHEQLTHKVLYFKPFILLKSLSWLVETPYGLGLHPILMITVSIFQILALTQANKELQKHVRDLERQVQSNQHARRKVCGSQTSGSGSGSPEGKVLTEITNLRRHCSTDMSDYVSEEHEQEERVYPVSSKPTFSFCFCYQQS